MGDAKMTNTPAPLLKDLPVQSRGQISHRSGSGQPGHSLMECGQSTVENRGRPLPLNRELEQVLQRG